MRDLRHCHRVLCSDIRECRIFLAHKEPGESVEYLMQLIGDDKRVLSHIERVLGYVLAYKFDGKWTRWDDTPKEDFAVVEVKSLCGNDKEKEKV